MAKVSKPLTDRVSLVCRAVIGRFGGHVLGDSAVMLSSWRLAGELDRRSAFDGSTPSAERICADVNEILRQMPFLRRADGGQHDLITPSNDAWFYEVRK